MATTRNIPNRMQFPGYGNLLMFDTFRGRVRIRKWPDKRGRPKTATVRLINSRFAQATYLAKRCDAGQMIEAMERTKGTGLYPRDLLAKFIPPCPLLITTPDGTAITKEQPGVFPVAFQGARVERTTAQTLAAGVLTTMIWQAPIIDTAALWSAGAPTRLTVPPGVSKIRIEAGLITNSATAGLYSYRLGKNGVFTQAGARDVMAEAMVRAEKADFPLVLTVHDELISEVDEDRANVREFENLMCELPAWATGLPVAAAGVAARRYGK